MSLAADPSLIDKIAAHMLDAFTFDLSRYLIAASIMFGIILLFRGWAEARRIQQRRPSPQDYTREFLSSIRSVFFFSVTTLATLFLRDAGIILLDLEQFSLALLLAQTAAMILAHDAYFYWMHRTLHHRRLFRATHLHHHKSRTPSPWTAYSFSVSEAIFEAAFVPLFLLAASLFGVAYAGMAVLLFIWIQIARNVMGHAGVELHPAGWVDSKWTDWISTTTHHDLHHSDGRYNYGFYFTWWDRWMGTEHPQYKERFRSVAKPIAWPRLGLTGASGSLIAASAVSISAMGATAVLASMGALGA